jgi:L-glyceraldehyde 3-phosphate reductase
MRQQRERIGTVREKVRQLAAIAQTRGQTLPQMAIAWTLRFPDVTTALIGASDIDQLEENVKALENLNFSPEEIARIDAVLQGGVVA